MLSSFMSFLLFFHFIFHEAVYLLMQNRKYPSVPVLFLFAGNQTMSTIFSYDTKVNDGV